MNCKIRIELGMHYICPELMQQAQKETCVGLDFRGLCSARLTTASFRAEDRIHDALDQKEHGDLHGQARSCDRRFYLPGSTES